MLPIPISRNIILSLISSIVFCVLLIIVFAFNKGIEYNFFIPTSLPELLSFDSEWPFLSFILSLIIYLLSGLIWNQRLINSEVLIQDDYSQIYNFTLTGGIIYFTCPSILMSIAIFLLTLALNRIFRVNKNTDTAYSICFDSGLYIGLASFFIFPLILFVPFIWLSMVTLKSLGIKEFFWSIIGTSFPYIFLFLTTLLFDWQPNFFPSEFLNDLSFEADKSWELIAFYIISLFALLLGYLDLAKQINQSSVRFKIIINTLLIFFIFNLVFTAVLVGLNGFETISIFFVFILPFFWHCNASSRKHKGLSIVLYIFWLVSIGVVLFR